MTDEMMTLRGLREKSADADLLREMIGFAAERLMLEVGGLTGAANGEKSAERLATLHSGCVAGNASQHWAARRLAAAGPISSRHATTPRFDWVGRTRERRRPP